MNTFVPLKGYETLYKINKKGIIKNATGTVMKAYTNENSYKRITLFKDGKKSGHYIHVLVANQFLPSPEKSKTQVDHKNRKRNDTNIDNLHFVTPKQNSANRG